MNWDRIQDAIRNCRDRLAINDNEAAFLRASMALYTAAKTLDAAHEAFKRDARAGEPGDLDALFAGYDVLKAAIRQAENAEAHE